MMAPRVQPRPDQVAELTRGVRLPLPAIADVHIGILAEGLSAAYEDLCVRQPVAMASDDEPEVTALMEARLNSLIDENILWGQLVLCVARGKESLSFDGSHLEKRPDLLIYLSDRSRRFPLVVEAKILNVDKGKTVASYCKNGLLRFVVGEYAWASREAFMVGYVRDGSSIDTTLRPRLAEAMALSPPTYLVEALPFRVSSAGQDLAHTRHGRDFAYGCQPPRASPGPISVWHLWLSCAEG